MSAALVCAAQQRQTVTLSVPSGPLLPEKFGDWTKAPAAVPGAYPLALADLNKAALEEGQPQRSAVGVYTRAGRSIYIEAIEFIDRSGADNAFSLAQRAWLKPAKDLGNQEAIGNDQVLIEAGATLALINGANTADTSSLKPLVDALPKVTGNKAVPPLLPTLAPAKGLVPGSLRYALGPETYAAEGGVLPANALGWSKSAEAVTAQYADRRGKETLTLLIYPTPQIAGAYLQSIRNGLPGLGPSFANAKTHRDGLVVALASGSFSAADAQQMVDGVRLRQDVSIDKDVQPVFHTEVQKTVSLLVNILVLSGIIMVAAVLLALFLGGGRALMRIMRGKSAAIEPEFLSLHLAQQNKPANFTGSD